MIARQDYDQKERKLRIWDDGMVPMPSLDEIEAVTRRDFPEAETICLYIGGSLYRMILLIGDDDESDGAAPRDQ